MITRATSGGATAREVRAAGQRAPARRAIEQWLTDFADQAVVLPVLLAVGMMLGLGRRWSQAACWFAAIVPVLAVVGAVKSLAYACAWLWPLLDSDRLNVRSPSGHTASAAVLYGSLAGLLAIRSRRVRAITLLGGRRERRRRSA